MTSRTLSEIVEVTRIDNPAELTDAELDLVAAAGLINIGEVEGVELNANVAIGSGNTQTIKT